jgi:NADP-dependent 3-hydroxy acid dehydrogenase YdfG
MQEPNGKVGIITGASRGIRAATARELTRLGVSFILAAHTSNQIEVVAGEIRHSGGAAQAIVCDVSRYAGIVAVAERWRSALGRVAILVNNAGVIESIGRLADSDAEQWDRAVDINLKGVDHALRAVIPAMVAHRSSVIVNISSGAATSALQGWSHYCSTKAAVLSHAVCRQGVWPEGDPRGGLEPRHRRSRHASRHQGFGYQPGEPARSLGARPQRLARARAVA